MVFKTPDFCPNRQASVKGVNGYSVPIKFGIRVPGSRLFIAL